VWQELVTADYIVSFGEAFFVDCLTLQMQAQQSSEMSVSDIIFQLVSTFHHFFVRILCVILLHAPPFVLTTANKPVGFIDNCTALTLRKICLQYGGVTTNYSSEHCPLPSSKNRNSISKADNHFLPHPFLFIIH
jgi:hypothetical protein